MRYSKWLLVAVCLLSPLSWSQVWPSGGPVVNNTGQPLGGATIAVCTTNPGTGACVVFVPTFTDATLTTPCTLNPTTPGPIQGIGCTNPGLADSRGNYNIFAASGSVYYAQFSGYSMVTYSTPFTTGGGGGGSVTGALCQPIYGNGLSPVAAVQTQCAADLFPGTAICDKINNAVAAIPATGGKIVTSCQNYATACTSAILLNKDHVTLEGCGNGNALANNSAATVINFAAGVPGMVATADRPVIRNMRLVSASTGAGTDDGIALGSVADNTNGQIIDNVDISGFGRHGINFIDGTDLARVTSVDVDGVKGDAFHWSSGCFDNNAQLLERVSATRNGGYGYNMQCAGAVSIDTSHASTNALGAWLVNGTSNFIRNAYVEGGSTSSATFTSGSGYNRVEFLPFGQPATITDSSAGNTNLISLAVGTTDGVYLGVTDLSVTGPPQNSPKTMYTWRAGTNTYSTTDLVLRDRNNQLNIYAYIPGTGHEFFAPVTVSGPGQLALNVNASPVATAGVFNLFGPTSAPGSPVGWQFTNTIPTAGQCVTVGSPSAGVIPITYGTCGGGGGGSAVGPAGTFQGSDGAGNFTALAMVDNGATIVSSELLNVPQLTTGAGSPACGSTTSGCWSAAQGTTSCTPTAGHNCIRATSTGWVQTIGTASETPLGNPGTVTSVGAGNLSPIFTTTTSNSTTTPLINFTMSTIGGHRFLGNNTGSTAAIASVSPACADLSDASAFCNGTAAASLSVGALANGMTATTQTVGDNTAKLATDAFVIANVAVGAGTGFNGGAGTSYQDGMEIAAPSNPAATFDRAFFNSSTHLLDCKTASGGSCMPSSGTAAFNTITGGTNTGAAMIVGTGASFQVDYNTASLASPLTGTLLQLGQSDGVAARAEIDSFASTAFFSSNRSNGTAASPSSLVANDQIGGVNAFGHNGTAVVGPQASLRSFAAQNWSVGSNGTYMDLAVTPNGSTTLTSALRVENDGGITIPSSVTGGSKGASTVNAHAYYQDGTQLSGTLIAYSNLSTGISMTSGTGPITSGLTGTGCTSGLCTMTTPGSDGEYKLVAQIVTTTAGSGGTCNAGTIQFNFCYRDAISSAAAYTCSTSIPILKFAALNTSGTVSYVGNVAMVSGVVAPSANWTSVPTEFAAKSGTAIQAQINQTVGSNCSTPPVFAVKFALYGPLGY